jgi:hypothetical protein
MQSFFQRKSDFNRAVDKYAREVNKARRKIGALLMGIYFVLKKAR